MAKKFFLSAVFMLISLPSPAQNSLSLGVDVGYSPGWEFEGLSLQPSQNNYDFEVSLAFYPRRYAGFMSSGGLILHRIEARRGVIGYTQTQKALLLELYSVAKANIGRVLSLIAGGGIGVYWGRMITRLNGYEEKTNNRWTAPNYGLTSLVASEVHIHKSLSLRLTLKRRFATVKYGGGGGICVDSPFGGYCVTFPGLLELSRAFFLVGIKYSP